MNDTEFLILGANGQIGRALQQKYPAAKATDSDTLDITDAAAVAQFDWSGIKVVFNAAAFTNVDGAQSAEGRIAAWQVNAQAVNYLTKAALEHNLTIIHVSTEYVFDGTKNPHLEDEPLSPLGVYAQSKAAADVVVSLAPKHYIIRTSWVIGDGKNFVRTMLGLGQKGISPTVIADAIGRPSFSDELVRGIDYLLLNKLPYGTYNLSNTGDHVSWADLTRQIFADAGFDLTVTDTTDTAYYADKPDASPRPRNSIFDLTKLQSTGFSSRDWREDLKEYIKKELTR